MSKKTPYSGIQIEASDNTYNVVSPTLRIQEVKRKEGTMNKEIKKEEKKMKK